MKLIFKTILIIFLGVIFLIIGFFAVITYQTRNREKIIDEQFHKNGNIALRKVEGYDCCEGFFTKTTVYDPKGRKIESYGNQDGRRFKEIVAYQDSTVVFEGYYTLYNDSLENTTNFDVNIKDEKSGSFTHLIQQTIIEDKIKETVDTIEIKNIRLEEQ